MRFGYWMPVFGGWLRNVDDERMDATCAYNKKLARRSEQIGFDLTLIAELFLNDIKGIPAPCLDAWSTAAALAAVTESLELMVAVRPTFHQPAIFAKQAANVDRICQRPAVAQRRVVVVVRRGPPLRRALRAARRPLRADRRVAVDRQRRVDRAEVQLHRQALPRRGHHPRAQAGAQAAPGDLRRRRVPGGQGADLVAVRRLRHARRRRRRGSARRSPTWSSAAARSACRA